MVACRRLTPRPIFRTTMNRLCPVLLLLATTACGQADVLRASRGGGVDFRLMREAITVSATVGSGATLASILRAQGVVGADALAVVAQASSVFDVRRIRAAQPYRIQKTID